MEDNKTKDEIFAEALIQIIENQITIKNHIGIIKDEYNDCYYDRECIIALRTIV